MNQKCWVSNAIYIILKLIEKNDEDKLLLRWKEIPSLARNCYSSTLKNSFLKNNSGDILLLLLKVYRHSWFILHNQYWLTVLYIGNMVQECIYVRRLLRDFDIFWGNKTRVFWPLSILSLDLVLECVFLTIQGLVNRNGFISVYPLSFFVIQIFFQALPILDLNTV